MIAAEQPTERARRRRLRRGSPPRTSASSPSGARCSSLALIVRFIALGERAFHHDESQDAYFSYLFRQTGDYEYNPLLHGPLRFYLTALMYVTVRRHGLHRPPRPGADGRGDDPDVLGAAQPARPRRRARRRDLLRVRRRATCTSAASPARTSTSRRSRSRSIVVIWRFIDHPRKYHPALIGILLALLVRDQGDDVHLAVRDGHVLPLRASASRPWRGAGLRALARAPAGTAGAGSWPRSRSRSRCCSRRS